MTATSRGETRAPIAQCTRVHGGRRVLDVGATREAFGGVGWSRCPTDCSVVCTQPT